MILVDYVCRGCGDVVEQWTTSPPPSIAPCPGCGGESRRQFAPVGLSAAPAAPAATSLAPRRTPLCREYPQIPALCHMSESAGRMWVAKYKRDNRGIEAELARQEQRAKERPPTMADAITHHHHTTPASAV